MRGILAPLPRRRAGFPRALIVLLFTALIGCPGYEAGSRDAGASPDAGPGVLVPVAAENMEIAGAVRTLGRQWSVDVPPRPGFNANVRVGEAYQGPTAGHPIAFVGSYGLPNAICPGGGIKVVDLSDPSHPRQIGVIAREEYRGTRTEDAFFISMGTGSARRGILVNGLERCSAEGFAGVDVWDVTDPMNPELLASHDTDVRDSTGLPCLDPAGRPPLHGVHEIVAFQKGARTYVLTTDTTREDTDKFFDTGITTNCGAEVIVLDITDPARPARVADWSIVRDSAQLPAEDLPEPRGFYRDTYAHGAATTLDHSTALVTYGDGGCLLLDISALSADPGEPQPPFVMTYLGRTRFDPSDPGDAEGDCHSLNPVLGQPSLVMETDEDTVPPVFGRLKLWDISDPRSPVRVGAFGTPASEQAPAATGNFSAHVPISDEASSNKAIVAWYSDGVRIVDLADPAAPREVAYLVPRGLADPYGVFEEAAQVWGVAPITIDGERYVVASDINYGLYVLRRMDP